jgi:hypothetical protein
MPLTASPPVSPKKKLCRSGGRTATPPFPQGGPLRYLFSSWLAALRAAALYFLEKAILAARPVVTLAIISLTARGGPGRLSTEVKRSAASHEGDKCPGRPPGQ